VSELHRAVTFSLKMSKYFEFFQVFHTQARTAYCRILPILYSITGPPRSGKYIFQVVQTQTTTAYHKVHLSTKFVCLQ
jgi:hypothetical protein